MLGVFQAEVKVCVVEEVGGVGGVGGVGVGGVGVGGVGGVGGVVVGGVVVEDLEFLRRSFLSRLRSALKAIVAGD